MQSNRGLVTARGQIVTEAAYPMPAVLVERPGPKCSGCAKAAAPAQPGQVAAQAAESKMPAFLLAKVTP